MSLLLFGLLLLAGAGAAQAVSVDPSGRYYQDGSGKPVFLIGYYGWAAVPDGYFIDHPSRYSVMIQEGAPYQMNYVRISLGVNHMTSTTSPQSWNNQPTPVPFAYVSGQANLDQWDPTFWSGLQNQCALAQQNGVMVHVSIFDGVELRGQSGASYGYNNSFWNPANQSAAFYPAGDYSDTPGGFYRLSDFNSDTGIGHYQRLLIAKVISETAGYSNVLYEIGNELIGSDVNWNTAVLNYIKSLTARPVTQIGGTAVSGINGYDDHVGDTAAQVKSYVASFVGHGYPAWIDPDGPGLSDANISPDELRRAAWYCLAGGAAGWGGFTVDYWSFGHGFNPTTACYYRNVQTFIQDSAVQFWNMVPSQSLVGDSAANACLARSGEYVVYVLNDASATVDLTAVSGSIPYRLYDPRAGMWSAAQNVSGGAVRTFNKPAGADDWVIYIGNGNGGFAGGSCPPQPAWGVLGTQQTLGGGITPGVATDAQGNIHVVYMNSGAIYYRKATPDGVFSAAESIPVPEGAQNYNSPHVVCDTNGDPHVVFERDWYPSASRCWYTNRKGGSWKPPTLAFDGLLVMYCRLVLSGSNAFVTASTATPAGTLARLSNLSGTPHLDLTNGTYLFGPHPVIDSSGNLFVIGRNSGAGHYLQQYDANLNAVGGGVKISTATPNKTGEPTAAVIDAGNLIHAIGNCGATGIDPESSSDIWYNNSQDGAPPAQGSVLGLTGGGWMGQVVYPHSVIDRNGTIYLGYRNEATGEGKISVVANGQFADPVTFTPAITDPNTSEQRRWNCQLAPAVGGGVYVTWDYDGICYIRQVGVPAWPQLKATATPSLTNGVVPLSVLFTGLASGGRSNAVPIDTTDDHLGTVTAAGENNGLNGFWEVATNAFDDTSGTKWLDFANNYPATRQSWIQYQYPNSQRYVVSRYTITSTSDAAGYPERNPAAWRLLGSNTGGTSWGTLDVRTNQVFTGSLQKLAYDCGNTFAYNIYRLQIDRVANPSTAVALQLDEVEFLRLPPPYSYAWSFGDGANSTNQNPQHTYAANGIYTATLVVSDGLTFATNSATVYVWLPLLATATAAPTNGIAPLSVQFTGLATGGRSNAIPVDTTDDHLDTVTAAGENNGLNGNWEVATNAFDNTSGTKWLDFANNYPATRQSWIQYQYPGGQRYVVSRYTITSANDAAGFPERNPADWRLLGSNNGGASWVTLDIRANQVFTGSLQKLAFDCTNTTAYNVYRFQIDRVANPPPAVAMQLDELEFLRFAAPYSYAWSFGDGAASTNQNPQHTYASNGTYTATLMVSDGFTSATNKVMVSIGSPALAISLTVQGQLSVSWPSWAAGSMNLWSTTNLTPPIVWSPATGAMLTTIGEAIIATLPVTDSTRFFRLSSQSP